MNSKENSIEQSQMSISWKELGSMSPSHARLLLERAETWKDRQKSLILISRDENQHLVLTQNIMKNWMNGDDPEMQQIAEEERNNVISMFKNAVEEEKDWAEYLFSGGSMIGLNDKLLNQYVEWIANKRMKALVLIPSMINH